MDFSGYSRVRIRVWRLCVQMDLKQSQKGTIKGTRSLQHVNKSPESLNKTTFLLFKKKPAKVKPPPPNFNMNFKCTIAVFLLVVVLMFATDSTNGFRKPPFNGSIFGKRTISYPEYENPGKTIYTMCEIASDACQNWFPTNVEKK